MTDLIKTRVDNGVLHIVMDRADKKNAITQDMYLGLTEALVKAREDETIRVAVISAAGESFSAGNDIADFMQLGQSDTTLVDTQVFRFLKALADLDKPLLAAVRGRAVGVGLTMLLHCDMVVVAEDAQLSAPFINLALVPEAASTLLLPRVIGHQRAFEVFALGEVFSGQQAYDWGLANRVVPADQVDAVATELAQKVAQRAPNAIRFTKSLMRDPAGLWELMIKEGRIFGDQMKSPEAIEAFTAFIQKRAPNFG
ncbi:enoyl-CoA hydratase [uncultured Brevundimonas sp.]|uniref:enoyl-CoA hydratase n=1 Tax=uncultured Brevundimonas sp. TaxID=213418 RepID=UPI00261FEA6A|nr:enoyl-CoA hydratase [uncultured Brevundimonas sp.]